ncbi:MAG TPA: nitronate monooxygenase [Thermoleophilaceae bacterium]|jgi:nitronate monooxygenase/enoyl-[acyl-carrier protein] reductase II
MLHTRFCELFEIEAPVLQAAIWPATAPELVAAVSEAGGIGSIGAVFGSADHVRDQIERVRALTDRPFVVNHVVPALDEEALDATLEARPAAVSLALGDPGDLVERIHDAGSRVIHQVHTVGQAREAAERGVDVVIAQGSEAGGQGMVEGVGAMALVPQVVDAVDPIPVLAAGGVADGRGLAAALVLGAAGVNVGTRFLASEEAAADGAWKQLILDSESEQAVRFETWASIMPRAGGYDVVPRVVRTEFVAEWESRPDDAAREADRLRGAIQAAIQERRPHELTPFTGQTAGLVHDVLPAGEIVRSMVAGAEAALARDRR